MIPIHVVVTALILSLRRRHLETHISQPFDAAVSIELDAVIEEQENLLEGGAP